MSGASCWIAQPDRVMAAAPLSKAACQRQMKMNVFLFEAVLFVRFWG